MKIKDFSEKRIKKIIDKYNKVKNLEEEAMINLAKLKKFELLLGNNLSSFTIKCFNIEFNFSDISDKEVKDKIKDLITLCICKLGNQVEKEKGINI